MNFSTTTKPLKYALVLVILLAMVNLSNAQHCTTAANNIVLCYQLDGNVFDFHCSETNSTPTIALTVQSITGGSAPYTITTVSESNGRVSETKVTEGNGFIYSFTLADFQQNKLNFTVRDMANKTTNLDSDLLSQLSNNLFSAGCNVVNPYFLVLDNTATVAAGENKVYSAIECILLDKTFTVDKDAVFEAHVDPNNTIRP